MYMDRGRHRERIANFRLCPDDHLETVHGLSRGLYLSALVASAVLTGPAGALASFVMLPAGAIYGSASEHMQVGTGAWPRQGSGGNANVDGAGRDNDAWVGGPFEHREVEGVKSKDVVFDVAEGLLPLLLFR